MSQNHLNNCPDWRYLLLECYELYRHLDSGGSELIRSHQRKVREAISRTMKANPQINTDVIADKPVTKHLKRALDESKSIPHVSAAIRSFESIYNRLNWQYGYEKMPRGLENKYAYAEICGPNGPVISNEVILGVVLFAPGCVYPSHAHDGITESYICLSGSVSENHQGVYSPGSMIFNPPAHTHRITVSKREPALLLYAWVGEQDKLNKQEMQFKRKKPQLGPLK
jgi:dimethylpropiothetin dethiomethylase